ncbi:sodium:solute symporter family protein [Clostridiaceae bacterium HSG29]|nr:sodium:solute symporter family protein [Clostridiaceae bacterium HSG29]
MPNSYIFLMFFFFYSIALLYFGKLGYKETNTIHDFFEGGGKLGLLVSIVTFSATWFSAASMQGLSGSIYTYGIVSVFYSIIPWFLGALFLIWLTPGLRASGAVTIPGYFKKRYNSKTLQITGGLIILLNFVLYIVIQIRGFGIVISQYLEIPYYLAVIIIYMFILYTTFGGLFSIARSDAFNFVIICLGIIIAAVLIVYKIGGISEIFHKASIIEGYAIQSGSYYTEKGSLTHPLVKGAMPVLSLISVFFAWGFGISTNPQYTVRIIAAKDDKTAINMIIKSIMLLTIIYSAVVLIGLGSRILIPSVGIIDSIDAILPVVSNSIFSLYINGFIMLAIMAAAISTANSQLIVASSSFIYDIFGVLSKKNYDDETLLRISRFVVFIVGSLSMVLSLTPPENLLVYGGYIWGVFSASFLIPLYGGMFYEKATKKSALYSMFSGLLVIFILILLNYKSHSMFDIHPAMPGVITSFVVFCISSKLEEADII